jgi:ubiquinone/menaquinone biosynthesis C-methylase UbiE
VSNIKNNGDDIKGINHKKLHEISTITKFLEKDIPLNVLEIGGGKGNLSYMLCKTYGTSACSIDMNKEFQELGAKRNAKFLKGNAKKIEFRNIFLDKNTNSKDLE